MVKPKQRRSPFDRFSGYLEQSERSPHTIKNYRSDLDAFAAWFERVNGDTLTPDRITPTDLRQYKQTLVNEQRLKPNSVNRKLATLRSFLKWALGAGFAVSDRAFAAGETTKGPRRVREERLAPRWLDRWEQNALLRAVERGGNPRDVAIVKLLCFA